MGDAGQETVRCQKLKSKSRWNQIAMVYVPLPEQITTGAAGPNSNPSGPGANKRKNNKPALTLRLTQDAAAIPNFKVVIYSVPDEAVYNRALTPSINPSINSGDTSGRSFANTVELHPELHPELIEGALEGPTARGGLATAYYSKTGEKLTSLNEVVDALLAGELAK